jgi:hypothetical protein
VNAVVGMAAGTALGGVVTAGLWLWQQHGTAVWLEMGLGWCF